MESPDQSDSLDWPRLIDKRLYIVFRFKGSLLTISDKDYLYKYILFTSLKQASMIGDFKIYQYYDGAFFVPESGKT